VIGLSVEYCTLFFLSNASEPVQMVQFNSGFLGIGIRTQPEVGNKEKKVKDYCLKRLFPAPFIAHIRIAVRRALSVQTK